MTKESESQEENQEKARKAKRTETSKSAEDTEFAEELTNSDIESAFQNPVTGEERLY